MTQDAIMILPIKTGPLTMGAGKTRLAWDKARGAFMREFFLAWRHLMNRGGQFNGYDF